jgi:Tfp pilus assembly protein PilV
MRLTPSTSAVTLVESIVAVALIGIGVASSIGALTKANSFASMGRNSTGAYTAVMNTIDRIQSYKPFSPLHRDENGTADPQIPLELQLTGSTPRTEWHVPIYKDPTSGVVVEGTRTTEVKDVSPLAYKGTTPIVYRATVTVSYQYLNRTVSFSMTTLRTSDE